MSPTRVFILASQPLFAQGVQSLLSGQEGIQVVGIETAGPGVMARVQGAAPEVVIVEARGEEQGRLVAQVLESIAGARVIGLSPEDNRIHIYYQQMRQGRRVEDLLEAIARPGEGLDWHGRSAEALRLFVLIQGHYGQRILENVRQFGPKGWVVEAWRAPSVLPPVVDDPYKFLPLHIPAADLVLYLGESANVAQFLPSVVERAGARAVIAPVDNAAWLPEAMVRQLRVRLRELGVTAVFPKPFCSLTEHSYNMHQWRVSFEDPWIGEFARHFGRPVLQIECEGSGIRDQGSGIRERISRGEVKRDAPCGCARAVAHQLAGVDVDEAVAQAGLYHADYPCLATMGVDPGLGRSLVQAAGDLMRQAVEVAIEGREGREGRDGWEGREGIRAAGGWAQPGGEF